MTLMNRAQRKAFYARMADHINKEMGMATKKKASKKKAVKKSKVLQHATVRAKAAEAARAAEIAALNEVQTGTQKRHREQLLGEIRRERYRQIHIFANGDPLAAAAFDDKKTADDWYKVISDYNGIARNAAWFSTRKAHRRMIQIAAVALAAAEALTRHMHRRENVNPAMELRLQQAKRMARTYAKAAGALDPIDVESDVTWGDD